MVLTGGTRPLGDVHADQATLARLQAHVGIANVGLTGANRLDLGPRENDSRLVALDDLVLVRGLAVRGERGP